MPTIFAGQLHAVQDEIKSLETQIRNSNQRLQTLSKLFTKASIALQSLQDASGKLPNSLAQSVEQELFKLFVAETKATISSSKSITLKSVEPSKVILERLQSQTKITSQQLQKIMIDCLGGSDAEGKWQWKGAYEAVEKAVIQYIQQNTFNCLGDVLRLEQLYPTHLRRTEDSVELQQFSTTPSIAYIMAQVAGLTTDDIVLEPSAGNGSLAVWAEKLGAKLLLNEICPKRSSNLKQLFPDALSLTQYNGENINDYLPPGYQPTVVLINPPFSASPNISKRNPEATFNHLYSAWQRLPQGGRLVALTADWFSPDHPKWKDAFAKFGEAGQIVLTTAIAGKLYRKQGTTISTRLTVMDKGVWDQPQLIYQNVVDCPNLLLNLVESNVPSRQSLTQPKRISVKSNSLERLSLASISTIKTKQSPRGFQTVKPTKSQKRVKADDGKNPAITDLKSKIGDRVQPITYKSEGLTTNISDNLYQEYQTQSITIDQAKKHPTTLVQSAAMATVKPPVPTYQPLLPIDLVTKGILSAPQLESIIYAGEAHSQKLSRHFIVEDSQEKVKVTNPDNPKAIQFRRGWLLGDGTGAGKGRQAAGIILDNWLQGRTKAVWISKTDKLIEDARRDWSAFGGDKTQIISLQKYKQGKTIDLKEGIIFATYALLRGKGKQGKISRVEQLLNWLGKDFDGAVIFDECHAMGGALASKSSRGTQKPSQQGLAGLRLQYGLPDARVVYVSATGATKVANLAYASRLGLWHSAEYPFTSAEDFIYSVEQGGLAAMEVVSRDLKSLGLYNSRSLSYQGVEYDILEHQLTAEQIEIYDSYAEAYKIIHQNLQQALEATHIVSSGGNSRNSQAKSAARSAFESNKQRFFNHLLSAMKMTTLIKAIEQDIANEHAVIIQIVSTNEALLTRRLADIPTSEWDNLNVDITPREYIFDYLMHAFPTQLHEVYSDDEGVEHSKPAYDADGNPVMSQEALAKRDELIESLALLPPIPGTLDQIIHHFGHENVAEVTGRSKRIIRDTKEGKDVLKVSSRPASANLSEVGAFLEDQKQILVFSEAGGTGASYHAALTEKNQRQRIHYLLEAGWRADSAIQGLGRSHRSHQKQPPIFRPVTTNVKGEKRFLSTIAKRLDSLGALTKGQRETGSQGIFKEEDNLESVYARASLQKLYYALYYGKLSFCSLEQFEEATGLSLRAKDSAVLKQELPPMNQFLNRLLALPVGLQNQLFEVFELGMAQEIEAAKESGTYEVGVEVLKAESLTIDSSEVIYTHTTGATTQCHKIIRRDRNQFLSLDQAFSYSDGCFMGNDRSGKVAVKIPTNGVLEENGSISPRVSLIRPQGNIKLRQSELANSHWKEINSTDFSRLWMDEVANAPDYKESSFYLITGLLLPLWKHIDTDSMKVWRLQTDDGQHLLGRVLQPEQIGAVYDRLGIDKPQLSAEEIYHAVLNAKQSLTVGRWQLKPSRVMNKTRIEVTGFSGKSDATILKSYGCFSEIINWQARLFIPANDRAVCVIDKLLNAS